MCGIAGIHAYLDVAPPVDRGELLRMTERMAARGPDGSGLWFADDHRTGFGHRRLAIIDLSEGGAQPMQALHEALAAALGPDLPGPAPSAEAVAAALGAAVWMVLGATNLSDPSRTNVAAPSPGPGKTKTS